MMYKSQKKKKRQKFYEAKIRVEQHMQQNRNYLEEKRKLFKNFRKF